MKNINTNTGSNVGLLHKFFACVVSFFILLSSIGVYKNNTIVVESAKVSADTIMMQFFYISTIPVNAISRIFIKGELTAEPVSEKNQSNKNKSKKENSSKASAGYSILPGATVSYQSAKVKNNKNVALLRKITNSKNCVWFENYNFVGIENIYKFSCVLMLLLAIILTRRNVGNDNIIKIINKKEAQLM